MDSRFSQDLLTRGAAALSSLDPRRGLALDEAAHLEKHRERVEDFFLALRNIMVHHLMVRYI